MNPTGSVLPPSSSLPSVHSLKTATVTEQNIKSALRNLQALYCPLRLPLAIYSEKKILETPSSPVDSGYVSQDEDEYEDEDSIDAFNALDSLRADTFEKDVATRWLTTLIAHADSICFDSEETYECLLDDAAFILSSFSDSIDGHESEAMTRDFSFQTPSSARPLELKLNDAALSGTDHTDVGLQSWGASIILSELICAEPERFGLSGLLYGEKIIELGAGTGLVSLALAKLLPHISPRCITVIATDYHPAVLANLRSNIATNSVSVEAALLDWSAPVLEGSLNLPAKLLFAADVVYAREHAVWLRDCAAQLLHPEGTFWLMVTQRGIGKFEGIPATVEKAFEEEHNARRAGGWVLRILEKVMFEKKRGIGRGDETGYALYRIGWAQESS